MTKQELIRQLKALKKSSDSERTHLEADDLLIEYINDEEIASAYNELEKWYA